jgi:hypothetical protein
MSDENNRRYQEIMRRMAERRAQQQVAQAKETLGSILDDVDALGKLEHLKRGLRFTWGPKVFSAVSWVGALLWQRGSGYRGYRTLHVVGVWVCQEGEAVDLIVGTKNLAYTAPTYEAEAYHRLMRRGFDLYYQDDGSPPPLTGRRLTLRYSPDQRLENREAVRQALTEWAQEH